MSSKAKIRNTKSIIENGTAVSIISSCDKPFITDNLTEYRDKYNRLNKEHIDLIKEHDKLQVKSEQMDQLVVENKKLITKNQKQHTEIIQLNSDIKLMKETSVDRGDAQRLEGKLKKKDQEIEELNKQIDSTKINALLVLETQIHQLKIENQKLKTTMKDWGDMDSVIEGWKKAIKKRDEKIKNLEDQLKQDNTQSRFDMIRVLSDDIQKVMKENESLSKDNQELKEENDKLKEKLEFLNKVKEDYFTTIKDRNNDIEILKEEHGELIQKLDKFQKIITDLYDDF